MRNRKIAAIAVCFFFTVAVAAAESAFRLFENLIAADYTTLRFVQTSYDNDSVIEENSGVLLYRRPSYFRLAYDNPAQPLIISDGETVQFYEAELKQVILRPYETVAHTGLFSMLSGGSLDTVQQHYILSAGIGDGSRVFILEPAAGNDDDAASIRRIRLEFSTADERLRRVEITDAFDGRVAMDINEVSHAAIGEDAFEFSPPPDTEIVHFGE